VIKFFLISIWTYSSSESVSAAALSDSTMIGVVATDTLGAGSALLAEEDPERTD
jgi:hypothetical protein